MSRSALAALLLVLATVPAALAPAQGEPLAPAAQLARLRAAALTLEDATTLAPQLRTLPVGTRLQGADALRAAFVARQSRHTAACQKLGKELAAAVGRQLEARGRKGAEAADALRARALARSRREDLSADAIRQEIDPLVAELEELLWPARVALFTRTPAFATTFAELEADRALLPRWYALYAGATVGLELHPDAEKHFAKNPPPPPPLPAAALADEWQVWTLLAMPLAARDRKALEANEALRASVEPEEFAGTTELNRLRFLLGLPLLRIDLELTRAARDHSSDMGLLGFFAHESPVEGKRTVGDRAARAGTSASAENIANGHDTGASAIRAWWYSPGHHRNLLGGHARVGLGRSGVLWTQMFGG